MRRAGFEDSALAEHAWTEQHLVDWSGTQVCSNRLGLTSRLVEEVLTIKNTPFELNRDTGTLPPKYDNDHYHILASRYYLHAFCLYDTR